MLTRPGRQKPSLNGAPDMAVADEDIPVIDTDLALFEEYRLFLKEHEAAGNDSAFADELDRQDRYALCLSGGGIRSAAFCMGAMRALAREGLLTQFHYLSMVSGGGYIGSWLLRIAHEKSREEAARVAAESPGPRATPETHAGAFWRWLPKAAEVLGGSQDKFQVKNLREFTNFLSPSPGLLSGDLGANLVLYLRNLIAGWLIFLPAFFAIALVPVAYRDLICAVADHPRGPPEPGSILVPIGFLLVGSIALGWSTYNACRSIPSHGHFLWPSKDAGPAGQRIEGRALKDIQRHVILPAIIWTFALPLSFSATSPPAEAWLGLDSMRFIVVMNRSWLIDTRETWRWLQIGLAAIPAAVMLVSYGFAWAKVAGREREARTSDLENHHSVFFKNWFVWLIGCCGSGFFFWCMFQVGDAGWSYEIATFGPLAVAIGVVLQTTFYITLRREALRSDLDREWLARVNASLLGYTALFALVAAAALIPRQFILSGVAGHSLPETIAWLGSPAIAAALSVAGMLSRKIPEWLGKKKGLAASAGLGLFNLLLAVAAAVNAVFLLAVLAALGEWLTQIVVEDWFGSQNWLWAMLFIVTLGACSGGIAVLLGGNINVNRFSMHAVYRNRLVRAFLGSAVPIRSPDSYVRFDPKDNVRLADLVPSDPRGPHASAPPRNVRLFPIFGVTLNLAGGARTDWTERKSASFTISPLHCGSAELRHPQIACKLKVLQERAFRIGSGLVDGGFSGPDKPTGAYARTWTYAGEGRLITADPQNGLTLGTTMALSGAAVSSNMGSRTSPAVSFLTTLCNLRLGMWLPNPAQAPLPRLSGEKFVHGDGRDLEHGWRWLNSAQPRNALFSLWWELRGKTDDTRDSVYLSDGGHFDNLGLYEMLRRRCRRILVIDVGYDPEYTYEDLATTLRRASIDLEVKVEFRPAIGVKDDKLPRYGLSAKITYLARKEMVNGKEHLVRPEASGELLIIKPWLPSDVPVEVAAYRAANPSFPHDATGNQFFTESQFESYRRLGEHITGGVVRHISDIETVFARARDQPRGAGERRVLPPGLQVLNRRAQNGDGGAGRISATSSTQTQAPNAAARNPSI